METINKQIVDFDKRLARIEQVIFGEKGPSSVGARRYHHPLAESIERLRLQVESLNPHFLQGAEQKLKHLVQEMREVCFFWNI